MLVPSNPRQPRRSRGRRLSEAIDGTGGHSVYGPLRR